MGRSRKKRLMKISPQRVRTCTDSLYCSHRQGTIPSMENKKKNIDTVFRTKMDALMAMLSEPVRKSQGGISDYSEVTAPTVQRVRGEFCSATFNPKVTLTHKTITFNPSCIKFFRNSQYVTVNIDPNQRCLIVQAGTEDEGNLKIANAKNGKTIPRPCTTRLCPVLFDFMKWDANAKYRIEATFPKGEFDTTIMLFSLDDAAMV